MHPLLSIKMPPTINGRPIASIAANRREVAKVDIVGKMSEQLTEFVKCPVPISSQLTTAINQEDRGA